MLSWRNMTFASKNTAASNYLDQILRPLMLFRPWNQPLSLRKVKAVLISSCVTICPRMFPLALKYMFQSWKEMLRCWHFFFNQLLRDLNWIFLISELCFFILRVLVFFLCTMTFQDVGHHVFSLPPIPINKFRVSANKPWPRFATHLLSPARYVIRGFP